VAFPRASTESSSISSVSTGKVGRGTPDKDDAKGVVTTSTIEELEGVRTAPMEEIDERNAPMFTKSTWDITGLKLKPMGAPGG
jgi:hypothetical protein